MESFGKFCYVVLLLVASIVINGLMFAQMYQWFIATPFNLPPIDFIHAMGIMTFLVFLKGRKAKNEEEDPIKEITDKFFYSLLLDLITLSIAWSITLIM